MRRYLTLLGLAAAIAAPIAAHADTFTYNLALIETSSDTSGVVSLPQCCGGSGSFSLSAASAPSGTVDASSLQNLSFTIDGTAFTSTMLDSNVTNDVTFNPAGSLSSLDLNFSTSSGNLNLFLTTGALTYSFFDKNSVTGGIYHENGDISVVPEPSTLALLGSGLLGVAGVIRRKMVA
jgi:hypothetical protein